MLNKILNLPLINKISCVGGSCYLIDFKRNLWSFGYNEHGQLGHGDKTNNYAKNSQNQIFVTGNNQYVQLVTGDTESVSILKEINSQYSTIWRDEFCSRAKSAIK